MLQFVHHFRRGAAHELDRILVAEVVRALHRVIHVPVPVVFLDIAERGGNAALRRDGMGTGRKHLGQHRDLQTGMRQLQSRAHPGTARADHHHIESSFCDCHYIPHRISTDHIE